MEQRLRIAFDPTQVGANILLRDLHDKMQEAGPERKFRVPGCFRVKGSGLAVKPHEFCHAISAPVAAAFTPPQSQKPCALAASLLGYSVLSPERWKVGARDLLGELQLGMAPLAFA